MEEAYEAYNKAISLEPANEGYKQNLKIVEDKLKNLQASGGAGVGPDMGFGNMGGFMSMFNNPQFINMASQMMADPQMQNLMTNIIGGMAPGSAPGGLPAGLPAGFPGIIPPGDGSAQGGPGIPPQMSGMDFSTLLQAGQQFAQQMSQRNPDLIEQFRQQMTTGENQEANPENQNNPESS
jgi:small glutamine-rich tetratricopeptide repeat-containing protein alpha